MKTIIMIQTVQLLEQNGIPLAALRNDGFKVKELKSGQQYLCKETKKK